MHATHITCTIIKGYILYLYLYEIEKTKVTALQSRPITAFFTSNN